VAAYISRFVMNNSVSGTVIIGYSKTKWIVSKLAGLTLVGVCMLHCLEVDWVRECVTGYVLGVSVLALAWQKQKLILTK
jgi:hypothetical protein